MLAVIVPRLDLQSSTLVWPHSVQQLFEAGTRRSWTQGRSQQKCCFVPFFPSSRILADPFGTSFTFRLNKVRSMTELAWLGGHTLRRGQTTSPGPRECSRSGPFTWLCRTEKGGCARKCSRMLELELYQRGAFSRSRRSRRTLES